MSKVKKIEMENAKISRCKFSHISVEKGNIEHFCTVNGWEYGNVKPVFKEDCEKCESFDSRYIEYPLTIEKIKNEEIDTWGLGRECGCLCEIKPCGEEYNGKSYVGIYIGDLPIAITSSFNRETKILTNSTMNNPAIFVPELKKIIYGCESWWREIKSIEDFKGISQNDIENTWYVKLLKGLTEENDN